VKVKHHRTVDCVVAGYSEHKSGGVGSLKLGLYDTNDAGEDVLHHVGVCSAFSASQRRTLAAELRPLEEGADIDHPWRFEGAGTEPSHEAEVRVPSMPNRWSGGRPSADWVPLRCERVVEVTCENFSGLRFRHPARFVRWRDDKEPLECRADQLTQSIPDELTGLFN
jgi:ATP-dependent DNA ligase